MSLNLLRTLDIIIEVLCIIGLFLILFLVIITYPELPDTIPKHWNYKGGADQWGGKINYLTLPLLALFIYGAFSFINMSQSNIAKAKANIGEITTNQIIRLARILKIILIGLFLLNVYSQSMNYLGKKPIIGSPGVLISLIIIFVPAVFMIFIAF
jgi:uncharacterized membrane protein